METTAQVYTYKNKNYPLTLKWDTFMYNDLSLNIDQVREWCREGCPNYGKNGGCPPYSPDASEFLRDRKFILLTCKLCTGDVEADSPDTKSKLMEKILCCFMDELGYKARTSKKMDFLNPGYCRGCRNCTIDSGCKAPEKRVYSITGTGIMLGDTIKKLFNEELQWFKDGQEPEYFIKIMALFPMEGEEPGDIWGIL